MAKWSDLACPDCGQRDSQVKDSRGTDANGIRRRRECVRCGCRFTTRERMELAGQAVSVLDRATAALREATELIALLHAKADRESARTRRRRNKAPHLAALKRDTSAA